MSASSPKADPALLPYALGAIERLSEAIASETRDLSLPGSVDFRAHSQRKSQGLMELSRLEQSLSSLKGHAPLRVALAGLVARLEVNHRLLYAKLKAARTVSDLVARAISEGQSDGTYSEAILRENRG